ncbi:hypothetical protein [Staphylococcus epidermidis]|uniref:hypothetical protein n=1 Tax=Staphylococcus epidermidis TaxID=1282 RepID=UPI0011A7148E|nr:hypothetical protein [Staphylococcus epidermidis]
MNEIGMNWGKREMRLRVGEKVESEEELVMKRVEEMEKREEEGKKGEEELLRRMERRGWKFNEGSEIREKGLMSVGKEYMEGIDKDNLKEDFE